MKPTTLTRVLSLYRFLLLATFFILLASCTTQFDDEEETGAPSPEATPNAEPARAAELAFQTEVQPHHEPNKYLVKLSWNKSVLTGMTVIQRLDKAGNAKVLPLEDGQSESVTDSIVTPGEEYTYQLLQNESGSLKPAGTANIRIPTDLVLTGKVTDVTQLARLSSDGRLFLDHAHFVTAGQPIQIKASEIISADSVVETFESGQRAAKNTNGRPGGNIAIEAKRASGILKVISRGEDGGDGTDGAPGFTGRNGVKGQTGRAGVNASAMTEAMANAYRQQLQWLIANNHTDPRLWGIGTGPGGSGGVPVYICESPRGEGERGVDGGPGSDGHDGAPGGDTGTLVITIAEQSDFKVDVQQISGMGGTPGQGGKGGNGGIGGPGGDPDMGNRCTDPGKQGPNGNPGRDARPGRNGRSGTQQSYCVQLGNQTSGDCSAFKPR